MEIRESQGTLYPKGPAWGGRGLLLIPVDSTTPGRRGRLRSPQPNGQDQTVASSGPLSSSCSDPWPVGHPCAQPDVPALWTQPGLMRPPVLWTLPCPSQATVNQTHTLPTWTQMHIVFCTWPHFVHSGQVCAHTHSVTHVHTHTQTHIDTHRWLCQPCVFTLCWYILARVHVVPPVHLICPLPRVLVCAQTHMPVDRQRFRPTNQQSRPWARLPAGGSCGKAQLGPASAMGPTGPRDEGLFEPLLPSGPASLLVLGSVHTVSQGLPRIVSVVWFPGGMSVSQCSKEDGRSSSGPPHETAAPKRTYDMMEGRVSRAISSASIEGVCSAQLPTPGVERGP